MDLIIEAIILLFALFGFVCTVFLIFFYRILKEDSKIPYTQIYDAEKQRRDYASKS